jgi:class 3 adenylate cyclase
VLNVDKDSGTFSIKMVPNPDRYEWRTIDGETYLCDKLDHIMFPEAALKDMAVHSVGHPITFQPPKIQDAIAYVDSRKVPILEMLNGTPPKNELHSVPEDFLLSLQAGESLGFAILAVDIVGSTVLSLVQDPQHHARTISTLLYEISTVVPLFHGHVLKYTGDGLIAYFPEPSFITKNDLAIDCALTIRHLIYAAFNPALKQLEQVEVNIRIGLDSGDAAVAAIGNPSTKIQMDLIGAVVNLAAKLQSVAPPGGIYIGEVTWRNLHTKWMKNCQLVELGDAWPYTHQKGRPYQVYQYNTD